MKLIDGLRFIQQAPDLAQLESQAAKIRATLSQAATQPAEWWSVRNAMTISVVVLAFGLFTIGIAAWLIRRETDANVILRVLATISIITLAVFLIVASYSDQQMAPAMGLLGTIAGYLLGKESRSQNPGDAGAKPPGT